MVHFIMNYTINTSLSMKVLILLATCSFMADTDLLLQNLLLITTGVTQQ